MVPRLVRKLLISTGTGNLSVVDYAYRGEVPERLNGAVSKTVVPSRAPRVRIPLSPPGYFQIKIA